MKDCGGNKIAVGDDIVFIHYTTPGSLVLGKVEEVYENCVIVKVIKSKKSGLNKGDTRRIFETETKSLVIAGN